MTIKQLQYSLTALGYDPGTPDGVLGPNTKAAVGEFQADAGLPVDRIPGPMTQDAILDWLRRGSMRPAKNVPVQNQEPVSGWPGRWTTREDFRCRCGGKYCTGFPAEPSRTLISLADNVREHFDAPILPTSGLRCDTWNSLQSGSAAKSLHKTGHALDFKIQGRTAAEVLAYVRTLPAVNYAYAVTDTVVHMDTKRD